MNVHEIAYHRNGVSGEPFYVVSFSDSSKLSGYDNDRIPREMLAVVFDMDVEAPEDPSTGNPRTAIFDRTKLGAGVIAFAENSWRGDYYDRELRQAIRANERRLSEEWSNAGVKPAREEERR